MPLAQAIGLDTPERRELIACALHTIEAAGVRYLRLAFPDLMGVLRGRLIRAEQLAPAFVDGFSFGCRLLLTDLIGEVHPSVQLGPTYDFGNFFLLPDPATLVTLPWSPETGLILADPYLPTGQPAVSSRLALRRAVSLAARHGLSLTIGLEVEASIYPLGDNPPLVERRHLFTTLGQGMIAPLLLPLWDALSQMNIKLDGFANEFAPGEIEFNLSPQPALAAADALALLKLAAQEMLHRAGYGLTFMAMFDNGRQGMTSGLHVHQSAVDSAGRSHFFDPQAEHGLSALARQVIAGQLAHAPHLAVFSTPTLTGYRRYRPGTWAPTSISWGLDNRTALLRVMPQRGAATRLENRLPDSAANPYLALAAMLAASVEGLQRQLQPPPPVEVNATTASVSLPQHIWAAIDLLGQPSPVAGALEDELVAAYRGLLLLAAERFTAHVTDWEIAEYRGIL